jgi:hypothetical protein
MHVMTESQGRLEWMPRKKVWRVVKSLGEREVPAGDFASRKQAEQRLQEITAERSA